MNSLQRPDFIVIDFNVRIPQTCTGSNGGFAVSCPAEKPYCVSPTLGQSSCSETPSEECAAAVPPFQCTGVGNYPDPCKFQGMSRE